MVLDKMVPTWWTPLAFLKKLTDSEAPSNNFSFANA